jgi:hypothetical protein
MKRIKMLLGDARRYHGVALGMLSFAVFTWDEGRNSSSRRGAARQQSS